MKWLAPVFVAPIFVASLAILAPDASAQTKGKSSKPARQKSAPRSKPAAPAPPPAPVAEPAPPDAPAPATLSPSPETPAEPPGAEKPKVAGTPTNGASQAEKAEKPKVAGTPTTTVEALRAEYDQLRDALFRSRARRETLEGALFSTQLLPTIVWEGGRHHTVTHAEVRFDGVRLWESSEGIAADKPLALAPKSAPPGPHVLGVRIEVRSRDNPKLGYVSDQSFALTLPEGKKTTVEITVDEDGDAPSYNPEIEVEIESK